MEKSPSKPNLDWVSVSLIVPNPVNPNRMTEEAFRAYVAEVRRLGRLPKPIVVRSKGKEFQIVDGEHGWKAAKEVGLTEVLVEVIEADDYELEVQCFKRNRGGRDDPVLLGQMFERMKNEKGCSNYELGADLGKSEGWVRVYLRYAEAAHLRPYLRRRGSRWRGRQAVATPTPYLSDFAAGDRQSLAGQRGRPLCVGCFPRRPYARRDTHS